MSVYAVSEEEPTIPNTKPIAAPTPTDLTNIAPHPVSPEFSPEFSPHIATAEPPSTNTSDSKVHKDPNNNQDESQHNNQANTPNNNDDHDDHDDHDVDGNNDGTTEKPPMRHNNNKKNSSKKSVCRKSCARCYRFWSRWDTVYHPYPSTSTKCCDQCSWTFMLCGGGPLRYFVWPLLIPLLLRIFADEKACPYQPACPSFIPVPFSNQTTTGVLWNGTHVANGTTYTGNATTATDAAQAAQAATIAVHDANDASNSNSTTVGDCSNSGHYNTTTTCQLFNLSNAYTEDWNGGYWFLWSDLLELGYKFTCTSMFFVFFL
jgi:hypothetical protein